MKVEQLYTNCLAARRLIFISNGKEAAVVDPFRDVDSYIEKAKERVSAIKYIFETHFHADFVSGHFAENYQGKLVLRLFMVLKQKLHFLLPWLRMAKSFPWEVLK